MTTIGVPDLTLRYEWHEGSVPPPFHYEYAISLDAGGAGTVDFFPDYPQHGVQPWRRSFQAAPADVAALVGLMDNKRIFERRWHRARRPAIGGSHAYLDATTGSRAVSVPAGLPPRDARSIAPVYDTVRALVPQPIWDELYRKYEAYQQKHPDE